MKRKYSICFYIILPLLAGILAAACSLFNSFDEQDFTINALSFNKTTLTMSYGTMDLLSLNIDPVSAHTGAAVTWEYDRTVIEGTADNFGMVLTAIQAGETIVRATAYGKTATCVVTILPGQGEKAVTNPYVYSGAEFIRVSPGETAKAAASLYGGTNSDINGYTFSIDKPSVAALLTEGNYCWITGQNEGIARVTVRHTKAAYGYSFLVSCQAQSRVFPYLTTQTNVLTVNRSLETESSLLVDLVNPPGTSYESAFSYTIADAGGNTLTDPPVSILSGGKQCVITPLRSGDCYIRVSHPDALYPLEVLVRVIEKIDTVYIEPSEALVWLSGASPRELSVSLLNLPPGVTANIHDFSWSFPDNAAEYLDWRVYGGETEGAGDTVWLTGKKQGTLRVSVGHPLAAEGREILIVIRDIATDAARASTYLSTSQNYVRTRAGEEHTTISIYINNASPGDEADLSWHIENTAADGSDNPVVAYIGGTGTSTSITARSAAPVASGYAVISPLRKGKAVITLSHPKAVYDTKILVFVLAADAPAESPVVLRTGTPYVPVQNGSSVTVSASLEGSGITESDRTAIQWRYSGSLLSLQANGGSAVIGALGTGSSRETVTLTHPKAAVPLSLAFIRYDTEAERDAVKLVYTDTPYRLLQVGQRSYLAVSAVNLGPADSLAWDVKSGLNTVIAFDQMDKANAAVTALAPGTATVTATLAATGQEVNFSVTVQKEGVVNEGLPCYLTTGNNVVVLSAGGEEAVTVVPVNLSESQWNDLTWTASDPALVDVYANGPQATVRSKGGGGNAVITVSHPLSSNTLEIRVHIGDEYVYRNTDLAYIAASADTLLLRAGDGDYLFQVVLAHTELPDLATSGFTFTTGNTAIAAVSFTSAANTCFITPRSPGQTLLTVSHPEAAYDKEVLLIVDRAETDTGAIPYLTTPHNVITVLSGGYATASVNLVNAVAFDPASWAWQSHDTRTAVVVANNGNTAMLQGDNPGTTFITVSNKEAPYPIRLIVICLDSEAVQAKPWIKTDTNVANIREGSSLTITAEMAGGSEADASGFIWSVSDPSLVLLTGSGGAVRARGLKTGLAYITVRNSRYPDSYTKTILVLVEDAAAEGCYITVNTRIVKIKPGAKEAVTVRAALAGGEVLDAENFIWWADDYNSIRVTSITDTARIEPTGVAGATMLHVKHPKAKETADIVVMVSAVDAFGFETGSKTVSRGGIAFIPLLTPPSTEKTRVEYTSMNPSLCAVTGSGAVAMIAGLADGHTVITATLKSDAGIIAVSELAVIVTPVAENAVTITTKSTVLNMALGESRAVEAALQGAGITPQDEYDLSWRSSDSGIVDILATEQNVTKGNSAYITAKGAGEAVITVSHPKSHTELQLWVLIPPQNQVSITLDQTWLELYKDDGAVSVTATLVNGTASDYNSIIWTAPKVGGQVIISVSKATGKTCNLVPRNVGNTTLRAQLPNGVYADCIVSVSSAAEIIPETQALHVNPGYSQTIRYKTNPVSAQVSWIAQSNTAADAADYFTFQVNEAAKTITVTGIKLGSGMLNGYFVGTSGGTTTRIQVYVEYTYEFTLKTSGVITKEPRNGTTIAIPFTVFPPDLEIGATVSDTTKLEVASISCNAVTGEGEVVVTALGEKNGLSVTLSATNPQDRNNTPILRTQYINLRYENLTITPVFDLEAGAFSYYDERTNTLYLGDGEEALFHLDILEENAELENLQVFWQSVSGAEEDNREVKDGGYISLSKENGVSDSGEPLWRIGHKMDHISQDLFYLISRDLFYSVFAQTYTYTEVIDPPTESNPNGGSHIEVTTTPAENTTYSAAQNQGITRWWVDVH